MVTCSILKKQNKTKQNKKPGSWSCGEEKGLGNCDEGRKLGYREITSKVRVS
jgi:hypothetical protein